MQNTGKQNFFNRTADGFMDLVLPGLIRETVCKPTKVRADAKDAKKAPKPSVSVAPPVNGKGWTGICGGPTVETLLDAPPLMAATLKQRAINGVAKGPIPEDLINEMRKAWQVYRDMPEMRDAAERMLLSPSKSKGKTTEQVKVGNYVITISNKPGEFEGFVSTILPSVPVYVKDGEGWKLLSGREKKAA